MSNHKPVYNQVTGGYYGPVSETTKELVTETQLQAAFLAARAHGKILSDEVLRDIIVAARKTQTP